MNRQRGNTRIFHAGPPDPSGVPYIALFVVSGFFLELGQVDDVYNIAAGVSQRSALAVLDIKGLNQHLVAFVDQMFADCLMPTTCSSGELYPRLWLSRRPDAS